MTPDALIARMQETEASPVLCADERQYSYGQLLARVADLRAQFDREACARRVVLLDADYGFDAVAALLALWCQGNVVALIAGRPADDVARLVEVSNANFVVRVSTRGDVSVERRSAEVRHALLSPLCASGEGGFVIFSSGTTGVPRASLHRLLPMLSKHGTGGRAIRTISFLLFDHIGGLNTLVRTLMNGGALVVLGDRHPVTVAKAVERWAVQALVTSPTFLNLLLLSGASRQYDLSSLEVINYGTEPMPLPTLAALREVVPKARLRQSYGSTETGVISTRSESSSSNLIRLDAANCTFRVVDGLLEVKGSTAMVGYLDGESPFTPDGYVKTGDAVVQHGEFFYIAGRQSELINVGGEKFYPADVEEVLLTMPGVIDVAVSKRASPIVGHAVAATFRLETSEAADAFQKRLYVFCRGRLTPAKVPRFIDLTLDELHGTRFKKVRTSLENRRV